MLEPEPSTKPRSRSAQLAWPIAFVVVCGLMLVSVVAVYFFVKAQQVPRKVLEGSREVLADLEGLASAFRQGTVQSTFLSHATSVSGSSFFQFATLDEMEFFERTDSTSVLWGRLALPDVVVSARAPVQYTYYLDLNGTWHMELNGPIVEVLAPPIQFNRPAIDMSQIEYEIEADSLLRDEDGALATLQSGLSQMAEQRAEDNRELVREIGRRRTEQFVEAWLLQWTENRGFDSPDRYHVDVRFADEADSPELSLRVAPPD